MSRRGAEAVQIVNQVLTKARLPRYPVPMTMMMCIITCPITV
ncbi:hypothetical protein Z946_3690 [Sulfitobacter noctilucicola]|nr:hypothetical protein Z946_3690 [Sulfitobacter noctilucicola]